MGNWLNFFIFLSIGATITNYTDILSGSEAALQDAVARVGPIGVGIYASHHSFQFYSSGVYNETNCGNTLLDIDHGVTVVGYGTENGVEYWLVKNFFGKQWGESGFIKMSRNKNNQ